MPHLTAFKPEIISFQWLLIPKGPQVRSITLLIIKIVAIAMSRFLPIFQIWIGAPQQIVGGT